MKDRKLVIEPTEGGIVINCDRETARLIADALDVINPDDPDESVLASDFAFTISTALDRWGD